MSDGLNSGRCSFGLRLLLKIHGSNLFDGMLWQRETRGMMFGVRGGLEVGKGVGDHWCRCHGEALSKGSYCSVV